MVCGRGGALAAPVGSSDQSVTADRARRPACGHGRLDRSHTLFAKVWAWQLARCKPSTPLRHHPGPSDRTDRRREHRRTTMPETLLLTALLFFTIIAVGTLLV